jgi:hypothetical protein
MTFLARRDAQALFFRRRHQPRGHRKPRVGPD